MFSVSFRAVAFPSSAFFLAASRTRLAGFAYEKKRGQKDNVGWSGWEKLGNLTTDDKTNLRQKK
jgi:hypothetical protein